jgi:hypothetical protein
VDSKAVLDAGEPAEMSEKVLSTNAILLLVFIAMVTAYILLAGRNRAKEEVSKYSPSSPSKLKDDGSQTKRILVLVNPHGGSKTGPTIFNDVLQPMCEKAGIIVDVTYTTHAGHAHTIAKDVALDNAARQKQNKPRKYQVVCTVSGDGMLHEVFNGLASAAGLDDLKKSAADHIKGQPVSILPAGTSNGIATTMTGSTPFIAVKKLIEGSEVPVDMYRTQYGDGTNDVWDCHVLSWGIIAEHDSLVESTLRFLGKTLKLLVAPVIVILRANTHAGRFYFVPAKKSKMPTSVPFYNVFLCPIATNYCQLYVD